MASTHVPHLPIQARTLVLPYAAPLSPACPRIHISKKKKKLISFASAQEPQLSGASLWLAHPTTTVQTWLLGKKPLARCSGLPTSSETRRLMSDLLIYSLILIQLLARNINVLQFMKGKKCFLICNSQVIHTKIDLGFQYHNSGTSFSLHFPRAQVCHREMGRTRKEPGP